MHLINNMKRNSKDNLMEYLVELAENEVPITYKSLINTLHVFKKTTIYYRNHDLKTDIFGGWIAASIGSHFTLIDIVPYSRELKKADIIYDDDEILIVRIVIENSYVRYKNNKYCR